ncbi:hypothetical protein C5167_002375 [Papaver somniferum]|uniref:Uncharacterized protein n=1 Tax=Papaver somniferum TaxID=3469 RepID=A0A4Y7L198_PAPSO|nr:hypothetical protein C5167_002375 [Papaver somniferum]
MKLMMKIQKKKNTLTNFDTGFVVVVFLFLYSKKGICITNYGKTWEKLMMAKAYYAKVLHMQLVNLILHTYPPNQSLDLLIGTS